MTDNSNSQITVNLTELSFSITGSEAFIEKHIENLKTYINEKSAAPVKIAAVNSNSQIQTEEKKPAGSASNVDKYIENGIYDVDEETNEVSILKAVPGSNKAAKAKNVALILLYAKGTEIQGSEIIPHCVEQACYDMANFSAIFKKKDGNFIRKGNGSSWSLKLTIPGRQAAQKLLEEMI